MVKLWKTIAFELIFMRNYCAAKKMEFRYLKYEKFLIFEG